MLKVLHYPLQDPSAGAETPPLGEIIPNLPTYTYFHMLNRTRLCNLHQTCQQEKGRTICILKHRNDLKHVVFTDHWPVIGMGYASKPLKWFSWSPQVIKEHQLAVIGQERANKNFMSFFIGW